MNDWVCLLHPAVLPKICKRFVKSIPYAQLQSGSHSTFLSHRHHDSPFLWTLVRASIHPEQQPSLGISPLSMAVRVDREESNTHVWFPFPAGLHWLCGQILRTLLPGTRSMTSSFSTLQKTHFRPPPPVERITWEKKKRWTSSCAELRPNSKKYFQKEHLIKYLIICAVPLFPL